MPDAKPLTREAIPEIPPAWAFEMTKDELPEPTIVANEAWTRGQARSYMARALECSFTEVSVYRRWMVWDPWSAAREYREDRCECGAKVDDDCSCPWPALSDFWDESGHYCPWRKVERGTPGAVAFWVGEAA